MARMTKKSVQHIWDITNVCYKGALLEEYPEFWKRYTPASIRLISEFNMKEELFQAGLPYKSESINDRYLAKVLQLTSEELSLIVEADQKGKIRRSPVTIHAILDELLHRGANGRKS